MKKAIFKEIEKQVEDKFLQNFVDRVSQEVMDQPDLKEKLDHKIALYREKMKQQLLKFLG